MSLASRADKRAALIRELQRQNVFSPTPTNSPGNSPAPFLPGKKTFQEVVSTISPTPYTPEGNSNQATAPSNSGSNSGSNNGATTAKSNTGLLIGIGAACALALLLKSKKTNKPLSGLPARKKTTAKRATAKKGK